MDPSPSTLDLQMQKPAVKTHGANTRDRGHQQQPSHQSSMPEPQGDAEFWPLSGKPYFYVVLSKTHLATRFQLVIPHGLSNKLPGAKVPAQIVCRGKVWDLIYLGDQAVKRFHNSAWGKFVIDNNLAAGDACVFQLEGSSNSGTVKFKVQILKDDFPSELLEKAEGFNMKNPITID